MMDIAAIVHRIAADGARPHQKKGVVDRLDRIHQALPFLLTCPPERREEFLEAVELEILSARKMVESIR